MADQASAIFNVDSIIESIDKIISRSDKLTSVNDFSGECGEILMDSIAMQIQTIGEAIKKLEKMIPNILISVNEAEYWKKIARMRDLISHHYTTKIDPDMIFDVAKNHVSLLKKNIIVVRGKLT